VLTAKDQSTALRAQWVRGGYRGSRGGAVRANDVPFPSVGTRENAFQLFCGSRGIRHALASSRGGKRAASVDTHGEPLAPSGCGRAGEGGCGERMNGR
jgi:hypothetical protein